MVYDGDLLSVKPAALGGAGLHLVLVDLRAAKDTVAILQGLQVLYDQSQCSCAGGLAEFTVCCWDESHITNPFHLPTYNNLSFPHFFLGSILRLMHSTAAPCCALYSCLRMHGPPTDVFCACRRRTHTRWASSKRRRWSCWAPSTSELLGRPSRPWQRGMHSGLVSLECTFTGSHSLPLKDQSLPSGPFQCLAYSMLSRC